jgi:hypothetical protein
MLIKINVSIQKNLSSFLKILYFKTLGNQGWLPGASRGSIHFLKYNTFGAFAGK